MAPGRGEHGASTAHFPPRGRQRAGAAVEGTALLAKVTAGGRARDPSEGDSRQGNRGKTRVAHDSRHSGGGGASRKTWTRVAKMPFCVFGGNPRWTRVVDVTDSGVTRDLAGLFRCSCLPTACPALPASRIFPFRYQRVPAAWNKINTAVCSKLSGDF